MLRRANVFVGIVVLSLIWGTAFVAIKETLDSVSPFNLAILRFAVADVCMLALMAAWPPARPRFSGPDLGRVIALGLLGVPGYHLALNWGEERTSASVAALIVATAPVMVALLSAFASERLRARGAFGIALAFGGVALLAFTQPSTGSTRTLVTGLFATLGAPVAWAVYTIVAKPLARPGDAMRVTAGSILVGSVALLPFVRASTFSEAAAMSAAEWGWVLLLGAGASAAGYVIFVWALGRLGATRVSVSIYLVPVFALGAAWLICDEPLGLPVLGAAALVVGGVVLAQRGGVATRTEIPPPTEEPVVTAPDR